MRKLTLTFFLFAGIAQYVSAQAIIPFPNLREQNDINSNKEQSGKVESYAQFSEDYQRMLRRMDGQIEELNRELQKVSGGEQRITLERSLKDLLQKKAAIMDEIELVDDLQKFY